MLASAAAGLVAATPLAAGAAAADTFSLDPKDSDHHTITAKSELTKITRSGDKHRTFNKTINYEKPDGLSGLVADLFAESYPQNGTATVTIDADGNWLFSGSFPAQSKLLGKNLVTILFSLHYFTKLAGATPQPGSAWFVIPTYVVVDKNGGSWSRAGTKVAELSPTGAEFGCQWYSKTRPMKTSEALPSLPSSPEACSDIVSAMDAKAPGIDFFPVCL